MTVCPNTGKICYETSRDASIALRALTHRKKSNRKRRPFLCKLCGLWHFGQQPSDIRYTFHDKER
jgi:hypothetical protein